MHVYLNLRLHMPRQEFVAGQKLKFMPSQVYGMNSQAAIGLKDRKINFGRVVSVNENNIPISLYLVTKVSPRHYNSLLKHKLITERVIYAGGAIW